MTKTPRKAPAALVRTRLSRRALLRRTGAAVVLAPFVPMLSPPAGAAAARIRRLLMFFTPNGLEQRFYVPTGTETTFTLPRILEPLNAFKEKLLFLHGISFKSWEAQTPRPPNDHPPVLGHVLTANDTIDPMDGSKPANSPTWFAAHQSIDQFIAGRIGPATKFPSLVVGVKASGHLSRLSYRGSKDPVPPESDPKKLFDRIFGAAAPAPDDGAMERLRVEQKSVIDGVAADLDRLGKLVAREDKHKIDAHLTRLRALELELSAGTAGASCKRPNLAAHVDPDEFVKQGKQQMEIIVAALTCDLTRVVNLLWSVASTNLAYPWAKVTEGHHTLAHATQTDETKEKLGTIGHFYGTMFQHFLQALSAVSVEGQSLLDDSAVVWYSEHAASNGGHGRTNVPFLLAGSCGGHFRTGRFLNLGGAPHNDLFVSLAHAMGFEDVKSFGRADVCRGPMPGLRV